MEVSTYVKVTVTAIFAFLSSLLGALAVPVILMVLCNVVDYVTGLMAGPFRKQEINSYKSIRGIMKKISMWMLVIVGAVIDQLVIYAAGTVGFEAPFSFFVACIVALWIVCNELISILENIKDMGVKIPSFLQPLIEKIKTQAEDAVYDKKERERKEG